jgi:hypothetical protein
LRVIHGALGFWAATTPVVERRLAGGASQPIPPDLDHHLVLDQPVRFCIDFLLRPTASDEGGDPACWAHLFDEEPR